jgi:hypothetical protein
MILFGPEVFGRLHGGVADVWAVEVVADDPPGDVRAEPGTFLVPTRLIERQSTAPPRVR